MMNNLKNLCSTHASFPAHRRLFALSFPASSSLTGATISRMPSCLFSNGAVGLQQKTYHPRFVTHHVRCMSDHSGSSANGDGKFQYPEEQRKSDHEHCVEMVRTRDMEGYLCGLLMPVSAREAYFALRAFNVEIASIKDASRLMGGRSRGTSSSTTASGILFDDEERNEAGTDSSLGSRLRMQWWRDAITGIYDSMDSSHSGLRQQQSSSSSDPLLNSLVASRKHNPTLRSLEQAIRTHGLTHTFLRRLMEAREVDLDVVQYERVRDVAQYGEDTVSNVLYLSLECAGVRDEASDTVASDIGVGLGLITALRSTAFRATQGECSIPMDIATEHSITMDKLYTALNASLNGDSDTNTTKNNNPQDAKEAKEALRNATSEMAKMASFHLHRARENQGVVPKEGRPCLLPAVCALHYLSILQEECENDVFHPSLVGGIGGGSEGLSGVERRRKLNLMFYLGRAWLTGTF